MVTALRRAAAAFVLFAAVLAVIDAALFKVWHPYWGEAAYLPLKSVHVDCSIAGACYSTHPGWTIPMAIAIGLGGILVAALLYRPRPIAAASARPRPHL